MSFGKWFSIYYVPVLLWAGVIFYFSSFPEITTGSSSISVEVIVRKSAHTAEYALLGLLLFRLLYKGHRLTALGAGIFTAMLLLGYAVSDEVHQMFVPGRSGKPVDVAVDGLGGWIGIHISMIGYEKKFRWKDAIILFFVITSLVGITSNLVFSAKREHTEKKQEEDAAVVQGVSTTNDQQEGQSEEILEEHQSKETHDVEVEAPHGIPSENADAHFADQETIQPKIMPNKIRITMPFTTQAPFANWDAVHEETCEEASLIMVNAYLKNEMLKPEEVEAELQKLKVFQEKKYGDFKDSDMEQLAEIANEYFGIKNLKVMYDFDKEEIKKQLAKNNPIILPTAGRKLGNPNFKQPGPLYHNLVAIGYDGDTIITNDPGTRKGKDYEYSLDVLYGAIHDFLGKPEDIDKGRKAMIVVE